MPELHDIAGTVVSPKEYYDGPADETYGLIWGDNIHNTCPSRRYRSPAARPWTILVAVARPSRAMTAAAVAGSSSVPGPERPREKTTKQPAAESPSPSGCQDGGLNPPKVVWALINSWI